MAYSEAQKRASRKYNEKAYDQLSIRVPKGKRAEYTALAESRGLSLAKLITGLLDEELERGEA